MENSPSSPYSVFAENRPLRIAFIVDGDSYNAFKTIESIIEYNQGKWGGRFNPIILSNGKTIKSKWWSLLKDFDPDIIKSLTPLSKVLLSKINKVLSPYLIENYDPSRSNDPTSIYIQDSGLSVLPTKEAIAQVTGFSLDRTQLVLFKINRQQDNEVNSFIKVNFGDYEPMMVSSEITRRYPLRKEFQVSNETELSESLTQLNTFDSFVYPSLMCTFPSTATVSEHIHEEEPFTVVVGDSVNDIVYYWNRIFSVRYIRQSGLNALWVSAELASKSNIIKSLNEWIKRAVDPSGSGNHGVRFVSLSLNKEKLDAVATGILKDTFFRKTVETKQEIPIYTFRWDPNLSGIKDRLYPVRVNGSEAHITIQPPSLLEGVSGGEHWMTDVYIEYHPERFTYIIGADYWWQLPRNNDLAMSMFRTQSRICGNGIPAVLLKRDTPFSPNPNNKIKIRLLDEGEIFQTLFVGDRRPIYNNDPRVIFANRPFNHTSRSDKGRYLSGLVNLFGGLHNVYSMFKNRYWRQMFDILSQQNPHKDELKKTEVYNRLKKEIARRKFNTQKDLDWLSEFVLKTAKSQASSGKELPYLTFIEEAKKELNEYTLKYPKNKNTLQDGEVSSELHYLIENGVLLMGAKPKCPACGLSSWYHLDELKQTINCKGCDYQFGVMPEQDWYYKLNSLVQEGVSRHYLIPVLLVLGQLLDDARTSFIYSPSLDLYSKKSSVKPLTDADIVCIQDGKFIVGEVKNTCSLFGEKDFDTMASVALKVHPDKVIFASLDKKPTPNVALMVKNLKAKLKSENIEVEWLFFPEWIFEPEPLW